MSKELFYRAHDRLQRSCYVFAEFLRRWTRHATAVFAAGTFVFVFFFREGRVTEIFGANPHRVTSVLFCSVLYAVLEGFIFVGALRLLSYLLRTVVPRAIIVVMIGLPLALLLIGLKALLS